MSEELFALELDEIHEPTLVGLGQEDSSDLVNLQMVMVTSSLNHEYIRKAYERAQSYHRRQELLAHMASLKNLYYIARAKLLQSHPEHVETIEQDLSLQKQSVFSEETVQ